MSDNFSSQLKNISASYQVNTAYSWSRLFNADHPKERFIRYLIEVYHYIKHSCPFMELTRDKLTQDHQILKKYLSEHIEEEKDHDLWLLNDLEYLGFSPDKIRHSIPKRETMALVGTQLYLINEVNPVSYLGYIFYLESNPPTMKTLNYLSQELKIPEKALFTLKEHGEVDPTHIDDLSQLLDSDFWSEKEKELIAYNLQITLENISDLVLAIALEDIEKIAENTKILALK